MEGKAWHSLKLPATATAATAAESAPCARGWFGAASVGGDRLFVSGGVDVQNKRLGDVWVLELC